ncbi:MAG: DNA polymerase III subunit alpha, partial [Corynebacterium matruchotii]
IHNMGYASYFLIVWDFINYAREHGVAVGPGRGSAAGSIVAYLLGITNIDPLQYALLFERFLNPERVSMPDIDIDFDDINRGRVISYVKERYGEDHVAQIATFGTMGAKGAIRDVARVLEMPFSEVSTITKLIPAELNITLDRALQESTDFRKRYEEDEAARRVIDLARKIEGLPRNTSIHAAGVVIAKSPLADQVPVWVSEGTLVTEFDKDDVEALGLLKMDFLGLRNLTVIGDALENIKINRDETIDLENLAITDPNVYKLLARGDTLGVFQLDSGGMQELLRRMQPTEFNDIVAALALYRPGPMGVNAHLDYADRKNGRKPITPIHPELEEALKDILDETYGLIVYQEQIMEISRRVANYTAGEADGFRKAMGKKKPEVLAAEYEKFSAGMFSNGYSKDAVDALWGTIEPFASYAFNKSHAAGYGLVSYWTAYLKANYTAEYMAALLTSVSDKKDKSAIYLANCRHLGIAVLSPDVNESAYNFLPVGQDIRFGLGAVRNVGEDVVASIVRERKAKGLYKDFTDYLEKIDLTACNKRVTESLIKAGAFDSMGYSRKGLMMVFEDAVDAAIGPKKAMDKGQFDLFSALGGESEVTENVFSISVPDDTWDRKHQLALERDMLGLYVSGHPLDGFEEALDAQVDTSLSVVASEELKNGAEVQIGGIISAVDRRVSKKDGSPWAIVTIEDQHGVQVEMLVFNKVYALVGPQIVEDNIVVAKAHVSIRDDRFGVFCDDMKVPELGPGGGAGLPLRLTLRTDQCTMGNISRLKQVLVANKGDSDVYLNVVCGTESKMMILGEHLRVNRSASLMGDLKATMGPGILG